jgi:predicted dehydrogenase
MKFLIAGFGSIGRRHLRNLRALGETDIILFRAHKSTLPDEEIRDLPVETSLEAALAHQPDAVIIANPTALHMEVAIPAARAGCHLLVEKPIAEDLSRIDELEDELQSGGGKVVVGFQFRFHPTLRQLRLLLQHNEIGKVTSARAHWGEYLPGWHPWEDYRQGYAAREELGGGVVRTLTHPFDYLRWLLGEVDSLQGFTGRLGNLEIDVEDTAELVLHFTSGVVGSLHLDYLQRPAVHRLEIMGTEGMIEWSNTSGALRLYRESTESWESFLPPVGFDRNDMFMAELSHFLAVVRGNEEPQCSLFDGIQALKMALAAREAGRNGKLVMLQRSPLG